MVSSCVHLWCFLVPVARLPCVWLTFDPVVYSPCRSAAACNRDFHGTRRHTDLAALDKLLSCLHVCWFKIIFLRFMQEHCILSSSCFTAQLYVMSTGTTAQNYGNPHPTIELHNSSIVIRESIIELHNFNYRNPQIKVHSSIITCGALWINMEPYGSYGTPCFGFCSAINRIMELHN